MKRLLPFTLLLALFFLSFTGFAQMSENFEQGTKDSYATNNVTLQSGSWTFNDALLGTLAGDKKNGLKSARIRAGHIQMNYNYPQGFIEVSFFAANYGADAGGAVQVNYSTDNGSTWTPLGDPIVLTATLTQYKVEGSVAGNVRLRFTRTAGNRINIDDVFITDFVELQEEPTLQLKINEDDFNHNATFNFGVSNGAATRKLQLRNVGKQDLVITSYDLVGTEFSIDRPMEVTLASLESVTYDLAYTSLLPGAKTGILTINSNNAANAQFIINLSAETLDTSIPLPISEARKLPLGTLVTVSGWVTASSQFAGPVYFQDNTGGMAWYNDPNMRLSWNIGAIIGDSIVVTGKIGQFNNLLQIIEDTAYEVFPESNTIQDPVVITLAQLNTGEYEGMLVTVTDIHFTATGIFSGGTNYAISDASGTGQLRVDNFTNIPGRGIPNSLAEVTGVAGRFIDTHQVLPRFTQDIKILSGPIIVSTPPYEVSATSGSITFEWETEKAGHSEVRFGTTGQLELGKILDAEHKTQHSVTVTGLEPATAYLVQLRSAFDPDTSTTSIYITSTASPAGTTGEILTFFNKSVAHELATFREADQNVNFSQKLISYIQNAEKTAEFAFYSLSGTVGENVINAIIAAHNRGVAVRVVATGHTGTTNPLITQLVAAGVRAVHSLGIEQMHNKFAVIDAHHDDPSKTWIVTSSWNATDPGTTAQYQNMVVIQDVALARAYWYEFNQMWGAESGAFNASKARFGPNKTIVNPSVFWVGDNETRIEVFFSPQANTESQINRTLSTAQESIDLTLNLITRRAISNTMLNRFNQGVKVRGTVGVITGTGSDWEYLSSWADVFHFPEGQFGLLHHKYAIVDGESGSDNAKVITGSHNWSANANFNNDENTLVIHNSRVANEYFQEFAARYWQAGGEEVFDVNVSVDQLVPGVSEEGAYLLNYPNPYNSTTTIKFQLASSQKVTISVYDLTGRKVAVVVDGEQLDSGTHTFPFDASALRGGLYLYNLQLGDGRTFTKTMSVVK